MTVLAGLGPERVSESAVAEMLVRHVRLDIIGSQQIQVRTAISHAYCFSTCSCETLLLVSYRPGGEPVDSTKSAPAVEFHAVRPPLECPSTDIR